MSRLISPRSTVRVVPYTADGVLGDGYSTVRSIAGRPPQAGQPWAVYLADRDQQYRLICFDLDAHSGADDATQQAATDAAWLTVTLERLGIPYVVCESGPSAGRHVWLALAEPVSADRIKKLGKHVRFVCPSLDHGMLHNPRAGCARPPGAPHRHGGRSTVIAGDVDALINASVTLDQLRALDAAAIAASPHGTASVDLADDAPDIRGAVPIHYDTDRRPFLAGAERPLGRRCQEALARDTGGGDASIRQWHLLTGYAQARRHYADVRALLHGGSAALEHARSTRTRTGRVPRSRHAAERQLAHDWDRAVQHAATHPTPPHNDTTDDPEFARRCAHIAAVVDQLQEAADVTPGRWLANSPAAAQRLVYDALCLIALNCLQTTVYASSRQLANLLPVGRTTVQTALTALTVDGLIRKAGEPHEDDATPYELVIHQPFNEDRSPALTARHTPGPSEDPHPAGPTERAAAAAQLRNRLVLTQHDCFLGRVTGGHTLGFRAALLYARLHDRKLTPPATDDPSLLALQDYGLIVWTGTSWRRTNPDQRDNAAARLGVTDALADRRTRYRIEQAAWRWWQAELDWMHTDPSSRTPANRRPAPGQPTLVGDASWPAHPRGPDRRADYRQSRRDVADALRVGRAATTAVPTAVDLIVAA